MSQDKFFEYLSDGVTFRSKRAADLRLIYAPLCGPDGNSVKSAITPLLGGDIKIDKGHFLTKPVSREDLRVPVRNVFFHIEGKGICSLADDPDGNVSVEIGQLWHKQTRSFPAGLSVDTVNFVPVTSESMELMAVTIRNVSGKPLTVTPTAVIPLFGRALANKHDHEHVTSLLNRVEQLPEGVLLEPVMRFHEEGHTPNGRVYYVFGVEGDGRLPVGTFPTVESFLGESGTWQRPRAVAQNTEPAILSVAERQGKEASGAIRFAKVILKPGDTREYLLAIGTSEGRATALGEFARFSSSGQWTRAWEENKTFWAEKTSTIFFDDGEKDFSSWMRWVTLQPILRRIFGCSFLPDHDYGKGGKGWRDIWQDLLSLILIEPAAVRGNLLNNFAGVRIDGSNATIIGQRPGEFIADRNAITRVWMDHGTWPFVTTLLYINQTGDLDLLFEKAPYFCDQQMSRTLEKNAAWTPAFGNQLKDTAGNVYQGTILEHILLQNLVQFFNVGEHNITRLESADWNDGLDMGFSRGESVAFMAFYGGNFLAIADLLETLAKDKGVREIEVAREMLLLLDTLSSPINYEVAGAKRARLFEEYFKAAQPEVSGEKIRVSITDVARDLRVKGEWIKKKIKKQERISADVDGEKFAWFNGYYDNEGERVDGAKPGRIWMTLTGQVFTLMQGMATAEEAREVVKAVRKFLKDKDLGGFRLNTDFGRSPYLSLGRAFGFAFGTKENGAVFSHMVVMYSYALYRQGLAREGYEVLRSLYQMSTHSTRAKIYPGIPEYFDPQGRGMYHFLTGSASWYVLTLLTMAYGVRGEAGDLVLAPQLVREEFSESGQAAAHCQFAGVRMVVVYDNPGKLDYGQYKISQVTVNGAAVSYEQQGPAIVKLKRALVANRAGLAELKVLLAA